MATIEQILTQAKILPIFLLNKTERKIISANVVAKFQVYCYSSLININPSE